MSFERSDLLKTLVALMALSGLAIGLGLHFAGLSDQARLAWMAGVVPALAALVVEIARALRKGEIGLDIVAALAMAAALALGETLAAAVVGVMYSGGTFLESFAEGRARRDMRDLLSRVPRFSMRYRNGGLEEVPLAALEPGDRLLIAQGETVPVDGTIGSDLAFLDTSALTGEPMPVKLAMGAEAMSGATNAGAAFDLVATRRAEESTYAGIVRLVEAAQRSKAPMARLADQWSLGFLAVTLLIAGLAWGLSGDPIRAVAVLVVATPCPLILAVPVALVAGLSRAARHGVLIKGARPLEQMARIRTLVLDKTGTLTDGRPQIVSIESYGALDEAEILRLAATLDQASKHPVAQAIVAAAQARGLSLGLPEAVREHPGEGVEGRVAGRQVSVGGHRFVADCLGQRPDHPKLEAGEVLVAVGIDGQLAGHLVMADPLRPEARDTVERLRHEGVARIVLATGDRSPVARRVSEAVGLDGMRAGLTPDQKVLVVLSERKNGPVMMVGDGLNDAPALAAADVGVAMGARGVAASAEAADVVVLVDRLDRLASGIEIARRTRTIALQSVAAGIGLSLLGMVAAGFGLITPVEGAILQEVIDVAVILNALRTLRIVPTA